MESQKTMQVPMSVYEGLSAITRRHGIKQVEWAKAAGLPQPRIAELEKLYRIHKGITPDDADKRAFTLQKMHKLYLGLIKILGRTAMAQEMSKLISERAGTYDELLLMTIENYQNESFIQRAIEVLRPIYFDEKTKISANED